jgi:hypothetical protein
MRGGSWINDADNCRAAYRNRNRADDDHNDNGLRACLAPSTISPLVGPRHLPSLQRSTLSVVLGESVVVRSEPMVEHSRLARCDS